MSYQREKVTMALCEELAPLLYTHYKEIAHYQDIPLKPAFDQYIASDEAGILRVFTNRDDKGLLIGYAIYFVRHNIHYSTSLQAVQDVLFIHPERRGSGMRFIKWCDEELKREGVQATYHHVKTKHNFGPMLERMGYRLVDLVYARRLD